MKRKLVIFFLMSVFIVLGVNQASASSVYLGNPITGGDIEMSILSGTVYTFDLYIDVPAGEAKSGLFGAGIDVNYNSSFFSMSTFTPTIDFGNFTTGWSKIIYPGDDPSDFVTGDDFAFYVQDWDARGLSGQIRIGSFSLLAINSANNGEWLITTGPYNASDNFLNYDGDVLSPDFYGVNAPPAVIPIPSALLLLGSGLVGLVAIKRKRA